MAVVKLNQKLNRLEVSGFEVANEIVFNYFDKLPSDKRDDMLLRAIYIGVLALMEDRLSAFLAKTSNELGTELESLKKIFDMKQDLFYKTAVKGMMAEEDVASFLISYFEQQGLPDKAVLTGNEAGKIKKNKTGDILCYVDGRDDLRIAIECKFDKSIKLGDIAEKDIFTRKTDTVWSQLIEAQANRDGRTAILVLDAALVDGVVLKAIQNVRFIADVGFVAIIDSQRNDFSNLAIAYMLARDIATKAASVELDKDLLNMMLNKLLFEVKGVLKIRDMVKQNIDNNKKIMSHLEKSVLVLEFQKEYFSRFLEQGTLSKEDLLDFYNGEGVRERYKIIEEEIQQEFS